MPNDTTQLSGSVQRKRRTSGKPALSMKVPDGKHGANVYGYGNTQEAEQMLREQAKKA